MLQKILLCLLVLVDVCFSDLSLKTVRNEIIEANETDECSSQFKRLRDDLFFQMLDATAKIPPSGVLIGNLFDLGFYDECLSVADEKEKIYGKYCLASIAVEEFNKTQKTLPKNHSVLIQKTQKKLEALQKYGDGSSDISAYLKKFRFGICIPDKCHQKYIARFISLDLDENKCYTKFTNNEMKTSASIAIAIIYVFILVAFVSTIYDAVIVYHEMKPMHPVMIAFSMYTNGKKLIKSNKSSGQLECLNGIKALSMMWVVLGHTYLNMLQTASLENSLAISDWMDDPKNMMIMAATVSVDTFFTVGGMLTVYVFMKSPRMEVKESYRKIPLLYLHRYLRLTPAFAMVVLIYGSGLIKYISDGPKWYLLNNSIDSCVENWWAALTYIQNYMNYNNICVVQSWYLAVDFQLFLVSPFLLIPLKKWPKIMLPSLYALTLVGMIVPFIIGYDIKSSGVGQGFLDESYLSQYYFLTYTRFATYIIGMIAGYYIYKLKTSGKPLTLSLGTLLLLWTLSLGGLIFCIFDGSGLVKYEDNRWIDGLYVGLNRSLWSLSMSIVILLCVTGNGGTINRFLSLQVFEIISKLSYSMYLTHYIVIVIVNASSRSTLYFTNFVTVTQFFSHFVITLCISIIFCLLFESPMITIERIIFPVARKVEKHRECDEKV